MYEYLNGKSAELTPTYAVVDVSGVAYKTEISLYTYNAIKDKNEVKLYIHFTVREDAHIFFGFSEKSERDFFRLLISVSGIGPNTARIILSTLSPSELKNAIQTDNVNMLKSVKGIGLKTAQKAIIELKDKVEKLANIESDTLVLNNTIKDEALSALVMLGFVKNLASKAVDKILEKNPEFNIEQTVKAALKML